MSNLLEGASPALWAISMIERQSWPDRKCGKTSSLGSRLRI